MREEQSAPLANLSAVNYGNLPSCLSALAASPPFVSKSKAGICNIGTFSFLQGHTLHKCLMTGDIYSTVLDCHCKDRTHRKTHKTGTYDIAWEAKPSETAALVSISNSIVRVSLCQKTRCTKHLCHNCWIFILHKNKYINKNTCNNNSTEGAKILVSDKSSNVLDIFSVT